MAVVNFMCVSFHLPADTTFCAVKWIFVCAREVFTHRAEICRELCFTSSTGLGVLVDLKKEESIKSLSHIV